MADADAIDPDGRRIVLDDVAWTHIVQAHPDTAGHSPQCSTRCANLTSEKPIPYQDGRATGELLAVRAPGASSS
ncbi:MAG: hypothetical protein ACYDGN_12995 [Acidimicrobiales bacterium]